MKKILLALLASAVISPAVAQTAYSQNRNIYRTRPQQTYAQPTRSAYQTREPAVYKKDTKSKYKLGNPLYRPGEHKGVVTGDVSYTRTPKNNSIGQDAAGTWDVFPTVSFGLTDKLVAGASAGYNRKEYKSGANKKAKINAYRTNVGISYQLASVEGIDFNTGIAAYYEYYRDGKRVDFPQKNGHRSGTDLNFQIGKKIQNFTPSFTIGFLSDFWTTRGYQTNTTTYINPALYIDLHEQVGLNLDYTSFVHGSATYRAVLDFYPQSNAVLGFGVFAVHPTTNTNNYGALANFKFGF